MASQSYLVCATPRTGSTLLCEMFRQSGILGTPREFFEYLKDAGLPRQPRQYFICGEDPNQKLKELVAHLELPPLRACRRRLAEYQSHGYRRYIPRILRQGTTRNGVFGAKIMWGHMPDFLELQTGSGSLNSSRRIDTFLRSVLPNLKYIYVTRDDKLRQAVSLWRALQTQQWRLDHLTDAVASEREVIFNFEAIDFLRRQLVEHDLAWRHFFAASEIQPLVLRYEQFSFDLSATLMRVMDYLGISGNDSGEFIQPSLIRQSDSRSNEFVEMYESKSSNLTCGRRFSDAFITEP